MCLYKMFPSHNCSADVNFYDVTTPAGNLPQSHATIFGESKFYLRRRTAIFRAAAGGGANYITLANFRYLGINSQKISDN